MMGHPVVGAVGLICGLQFRELQHGRSVVAKLLSPLPVYGISLYLIELFPAGSAGPVQLAR